MFYEFFYIFKYILYVLDLILKMVVLLVLYMNIVSVHHRPNIIISRTCTLPILKLFLEESPFTRLLLYSI